MSPIQLYYSTIVNYRQSSIQLSKASDKKNKLLKFRTLYILWRNFHFNVNNKKSELSNKIK